MQNIETKVVGNLLTITIKLDAPRTASASGKSQVIGSTQGNVTVGELDGKPVKLGVNCNIPA